MIQRSFTLRVLAISFIVLALPLLVYSFIFFQMTYTQEIENLKGEMKENGFLRTFALSEIEQSKEILFKEFEHLFDISDKIETLNLTDLNEELAEIARLGGNFNIYILELSQNDQYKILASSKPSAIGTFFTSRLRLREALKGKEGSFIRYIYSDEEQETIPYIFLTQVILSKQTNEPLALLMIAVSVEKEFNAILSKIEEVDALDFAILNPNGIVMQSTQRMMRGFYFDPISEKRKQELTHLNALDFPLASEPIPITDTEGTPFFEFILNSKTQIGYRLYFPKLGLSVVTYASKELFFRKVLEEFLVIYIVFALILIVGGGVVYWLAHWISRPLKQLSYVMGEVSRGNLNVRFQQEPLGFEINMLGNSFNHTLDTLLKNMEQAEEERVKKERYQREVTLAHEVQASLLPSEGLCLVEGVELIGTYLSAEEVGGDSGSWIIRKTKEGETVVFMSIGDSSGVGISSCLYALSVRNLVHAYASLYEDVGEILSKSNNDFLKDTGETGIFMTFLLSALHPKTKRLDYYSCGHPPPVIRRFDGELITLAHSGIALGIEEAKEPYKTDSIQLHSNDIVLFFTAGLFEIVDENNQPFSKEQFEECLQQKGIESAQDMLDSLTSTLNTFTGTTPQKEDVVIIALKVI